MNELICLDVADKKRLCIKQISVWPNPPLQMVFHVWYRDDKLECRACSVQSTFHVSAWERHLIPLQFMCFTAELEYLIIEDLKRYEDDILSGAYDSIKK